MEQVRDEQKAFSYLMHVMQHGDATYKAKDYSDLAGMFDSGAVSFVKSKKYFNASGAVIKEFGFCDLEFGI